MSYMKNISAKWEYRFKNIWNVFLISYNRCDNIWYSIKSLFYVAQVFVVDLLCRGLLNWNLFYPGRSLFKDTYIGNCRYIDWEILF